MFQGRGIFVLLLAILIGIGSFFHASPKVNAQSCTQCFEGITHSFVPVSGERYTLNVSFKVKGYDIRGSGATNLYLRVAMDGGHKEYPLKEAINFRSSVDYSKAAIQFSIPYEKPSRGSTNIVIFRLMQFTSNFTPMKQLDATGEITKNFTNVANPAFSSVDAAGIRDEEGIPGIRVRYQIKSATYRSGLKVTVTDTKDGRVVHTWMSAPVEEDVLCGDTIGHLACNYLPADATQYKFVLSEEDRTLDTKLVDVYPIAEGGKITLKLVTNLDSSGGASVKVQEGRNPAKSITEIGASSATTPTTFQTDVSDKIYKVIFEKDGFVTHEVPNIRFDRGRTVTGHLVAEGSNLAVINFGSFPEGAEVYLGKDSGSLSLKGVTPLILEREKDTASYIVQLKTDTDKKEFTRVKFDSNKSFYWNFRDGTDAPPSESSPDVPPSTPLGGDNECNKYISVGAFGYGARFEPFNYLACQLISLMANIVKWMASFIDGVTTNPWDFIREESGKPKAIITVWRVVLGLVDFVVVGGLLVAAFANIFRFKLDNYEIKKILPGLIIGIVLANLSFFIIRLFIESASIVAQFIGDIVSGYLPDSSAIGNVAAARYLVVEGFVQLMKSLFEHNPLFGTGTTVAGAGAGAIVLSGFTMAALGSTAAILAILFLLFMLVPVIFIVILIFLLYLRNYILVALFMTAPFAFFSLGFPPLRNLWNRWWKTFWQWLIMLPTMFAVLGLGVLFLYFMNQGTERSYIDYFFVNGVAVAILYFAMRIPFMWGDFFGIKATDQWAKLGSKGAQLAHTGAKKGLDFGIEKSTRLQPTAPLATPTNRAEARNLLTKGKELNVTKVTGETTASYLARVNAAQREKDQADLQTKIGERQKKGNVFRYPEAMRAGWKARSESQKAGEEYDIKQNTMFGTFAGPKGVGKDLFDKAREEAGAIDDFSGLAPNIKKLHDHYVTQIKNSAPPGVISDEAAKREAAERIRRLSNMQFGAREGAIANDPYLKGMEKKKIQQGIEGFRKWVSLANRDAGVKAKLKASNGGQAGINALTSGKLVPFGTAGILPDGTPVMVDDAGTVTGAGPTVIVAQPTQTVVQGGGQMVPVSNQLIPRDVIGAVRNAAAGNLSPDDRETLGVKRHSAITAAKVMAEETERALRREMGLRGFGPEIGNRLLETIYKGVKKGEKKFLANEVGIPFEQLVELEPQIKAVSGSYKAMKQVMDVGRPEDGSTGNAVSSQIAVGLAKDNKQAEMEGKLGTLMTEINNPTTERGRLEQIHRELNVPPTVLDPSQVQTTDELRSGLNDWAQKTQAATTTLRNPEVQVAAQTYQASPTPEFERSLKEAISNVASQKELIEHTVTDVGQAANEYDPANPATSEQIAARVAEQLRTTARLHDNYRPALQQYEASGQEGAIDQSLTELAKRLLGEVQNEARTQTDVDGAPYERPSSYVADPRYHESLYQKLENALVEGFSKIATPPEATQPAPTPSEPQA